MTVNKDSSVGITEDLITNIMNLCASEYHMNILVRKYEDKLSFWYADNAKEDQDEIMKVDEVLRETELLLKETTENRRKAMKLLKEQANEEGNPDMWCLLKHMFTAVITSFEVWQVDLSNLKAKYGFIEQSRAMNKVLAMFLGFPVTPCSACLTDQLEQEGK